MALTVVIGPPAAGKSTWVRDHAAVGDIVIDFDLLALALSGPDADPHDHPAALATVTKAARNAAIDAAMQHTGTCDVYVIHSSPGPSRMAGYRQAGAKIVTVDPGRDVVRQRCKAERPARMLAVVDAWYRMHGDRSAARAGAASALPYDPRAVTSRSW